MLIKIIFLSMIMILLLAYFALIVIELSTDFEKEERRFYDKSGNERNY
jgi:hypothetical protein